MNFGRRRLAYVGAVLSAGAVAFTTVLAVTVVAVDGFGTTPALQLAWPFGSAFNVSGFSYYYTPLCPPTQFSHTGIDGYALDFGLNYSEVDASAYGTAHTVSSTSGYGNFIWIQHTGGYVSLYAHLSAFAVNDGQVVAKGQRIGTSGSSGSSSGPHLHFRVTSGASSWNNGSAWKPEPMSGVAPPGYTGFDQFGCGADHLTTFTSTPPNQQVGVSRRSDGTLDLLIRGLDGVAYHAPTDRSGTPLYWESLQLIVKGTPYAVWDGVASRLDVYAIGDGHHPYHAALVGGSWSGWAPQPGLSGYSETEQVNVDKRPDGTIDLFMRGQDGAAWHAATDSNGTAANWESLGGLFKGAPSAVWIGQTLHAY
jgi:hypothetical protein